MPLLSRALVGAVLVALGAAGAEPAHSLAVDAQSACALQPGGKVSCWGVRGTHGPVEVPGLEGVVGLAAGQTFTCAWTSRGTVACWGADPTQKFGPRFEDVVQVSMGSGSACALHATGQVSCWGQGGKQARAIAGLTDAVELAGAFGGGAEKLCYRSRSGAVSCGNSVTPFEPIRELAGATSLGGAGARFAVILPGHVATWVGWTGRPMPVFFGGVDAERVIVGGHLNSRAALCVLGAQPQCWDWGGEPSLALVDAPPVPAGTVDLSTDGEASCARTATAIQCWGRLGRLGDGVPEAPAGFVPVVGVGEASQLDAAGRTFCALHGGRVACWGAPLHDEEAGKDPPIELQPVELPDVSDAVELAMELGSTGTGKAAATAVCARRKAGATCWVRRDGALQALDAPELVGAVRLYSGAAVCGVSASGRVRCVRFGSTGGSIASFSEDDYERIVYAGDATQAQQRVILELEKRLRTALTSGRVLEGFHLARDKGTAGQTARVLRAPIDSLRGVAQVRHVEWQLDEDVERWRGAVCARRADGAVVCWGERELLGAGLQSTTTVPVTPR